AVRGHRTADGDARHALRERLRATTPGERLPLLLDLVRGHAAARLAHPAPTAVQSGRRESNPRS
ncbi:hypothetical protein, partial [Streptomyces sp. DH24]|uniref:hypothetical protein n=1 Tax=Streptomyces sp. DH24 TaxID=3040123 RepID=UPI0024412B43